MKKILLAAALCTSILSADVADYKRGFESAIEAFRLQVKLNNIIPEKIEFKNEFVLYIEIDTIDTASVMLLQYIAENEDFKDVKLGNNKIFLGSYDRNADIYFYKKKAEKLFGKKVHYVNKSNLYNEYTNPLFLEDIYDYILAKSDSMGVVIVRKPIYITNGQHSTKRTVTKRIRKSSKNSSWDSKYFVLRNNKAQSYYLYDGWKQGGYKNSENFMEKEDPTETTNRFKYARELKSNDGKKWIKVYKEDRYFLLDDIKYVQGK